MTLSLYRIECDKRNFVNIQGAWSYVWTTWHSRELTLNKASYRPLKYDVIRFHLWYLIKSGYFNLFWGGNCNSIMSFWNVNIWVLVSLNLLSPPGASKHHLIFLNTDLLSLQIRGFRRKFYMKLSCQYMAMFFNFSSTSSHGWRMMTMLNSELI